MPHKTRDDDPSPEPLADRGPRPARRRRAVSGPNGGRSNGRTARVHEAAALAAARAQAAQQRVWLSAARLELDESVERYEDLFEFAPIALLSVDPYGTVLEINNVGCLLFGKARKIALGRPLVPSVYPPDRQIFLDHMANCRRTEAAVTHSVLRIRRPTGQIVPTEILSRRSRVGTLERPTYLMVVFDLSERLKFEQERLGAAVERERLVQEQEVARRGNEARDRFLAMLSHELRTPLTPVLFALARLASMPDLPDQARALVEVIRRNLNIETQLISDLLDVNRIVQGKLALQFEPLDVHDVIREATEILLPQAHDRRIAVSSELDAAQPCVLGDPARLRQVFWNVVANALKFTEPGGQVRIHSRNPSPDTIRVTVSDTGVGIPPAQIDALFAPFEQSDRGDAALGGLGLGLTICRGITDAHRGTIRASSEGIGRGATFEIELPIAARDNAAPHP